MAKDRELIALRERVRVLSATPLADPAIVNAFSTEKVPPASPSAGPQRLTFYVPHHDTRLSLGQGNETYHTDTGIVGYTDHLITWDVKAATKTVEVMGATVATAHLERDGVPSGSDGYALVTEGRAYLEANKQHYVTSPGGDVIFHTAADQPAVLQSDAGVVEINAGDCVSIRAGNCVQFAATTYTPQTPSYDAPYTLAEPEASTSMSQADMHGWGDRAANALELVLGLVRPLKEPDTMKPGGVRGPFNWAPFAVTSAKTLLSFVSPEEQCVNMDADGNVSFGAGVVAAMYGLLGAGVTGSLGASLVGLSAGMKAFAYAGVFGGIECTLNAMKNVKITAQKGSVGVQSSKGTSVAAGNSLQLTAQADAQMDGDEACLSGSAAFVGAASNFGLYGTGTAMELRRVDDAKNFLRPGASAHTAAGIWRNNVQLEAKKDVGVTLMALSARMEAGGKTLKLGIAGIEGHAPKIELETS